MPGKKRARRPARRPSSKSNSIDPLVIGHIIGDVLEPFIPSVNMTVKYDTVEVSNGHELQQSATAVVPRVQIGGLPEDESLYTLVMIDPDAPNPSEPCEREMLHWLVIDIRGGSEVKQGREMVPYTAPTPARGIHRFVFVLFKQSEGALPLLAAPATRSNFSVKIFAEECGLGLPVAAVFYYAPRERGHRRPCY